MSKTSFLKDLWEASLSLDVIVSLIVAVAGIFMVVLASEKLEQLSSAKSVGLKFYQYRYPILLVTLVVDPVTRFLHLQNIWFFVFMVAYNGTVAIIAIVLGRLNERA